MSSQGTVSTILDTFRRPFLKRNVKKFFNQRKFKPLKRLAARIKMFNVKRLLPKMKWLKSPNYQKLRALNTRNRGSFAEFANPFNTRITVNGVEQEHPNNTWTTFRTGYENPYYNRRNGRMIVGPIHRAGAARLQQLRFYGIARGFAQRNKAKRLAASKWK